MKSAKRGKNRKGKGKDICRYNDRKREKVTERKRERKVKKRVRRR